MLSKLENPVRVNELKPKETLMKVGLTGNMTLCDIGAGTGLFSFAAAELTSGTIYALDISDAMLDVLEKRKAERDVNNLDIRKVVSEVLPLEDNTCDMAILVTVLHEIDHKTALIKEINRLMKAEGRLLVIDFHKKETPMGPPIAHRLAEDEVEKVCTVNGFLLSEEFELGENLYALLFTKDN